MPVEIRELIIRAVVAADTDCGDDESAQASEADQDQAAIVQACVRQVLRILKKEKER